MMKKLFISYRSTDTAKVDKIAQDLRLLKFENGLPRYATWQDKIDLPPASPNWWDSIVDAIIDCDVFVFHMSEASLQSNVCQAELNYAHRRNRPIVPIVLEDEFYLDASSGKYNIKYWNFVPEWLRDVQFLFYTGTDFYKHFQKAIETFERKWPRDVKVKRPMNPDSKSAHASNHALYDTACDYAERLAFEEAEKHFSILVRRNDADYVDVAAEWLEILNLYSELIEIDKQARTKFLFKRKWKSYQKLFPKMFLDDIFDPRSFSKQQITKTPIATIETPESVLKTDTLYRPPTQTFSTILHNEKVSQDTTIQLSEVQRTVGIQGGPNGAGTGFFVTKNGLIATTRYITGGERQLGIQLLDGRQITGNIVRSFPSVDLTLIQTNVQVTNLLGVSQSPSVPDNMPIVAVTHAGVGIRSAKRNNMTNIETYWFPTLINEMKDAGGNPIFDGNNMLVGMLSNNANRSNGYKYGLHIHKIYKCADQYIHEKSQFLGENTIYCNACGTISRAPSSGGYFCETCFHTHPYAVDIKRYPQVNLASLYGENNLQPCSNCSSQAGFYDRACLRCGYRL